MRIKTSLLVIGSALLLSGCYYTERPYGYAPVRRSEIDLLLLLLPRCGGVLRAASQYLLLARRRYLAFGSRVPRNIVLRSHVRVDLDSPEPYRHHNEVRVRHPRHPEDRRVSGTVTIATSASQHGSRSPAR